MEQQLNIYELAEFYFKDSKEYIVFWASHDDLLITYIPFKDKEHFEKNFKITPCHHFYDISPINKVDDYTYLVDGQEFSLYEDLYLIKDGKMQ
jgi:hypothetical protein